ncbi:MULTISPECIES: thiol reductant ABC exporter subunit CydD [Comamonas]|uniref:thiol reductant ABC exporter subunit CydD n=1 Tax=Comamonas TaxID=283 RepID=UPI00050F082C|nr:MULTISPECIES: thiol reductant ABC exporter subunit CydD [Comamonas]KGG92102.1 ABC transporter ATP-binding protein [Comamonas thiooxydans]KGG98342.1 ABC transporter ATP-binding protein [Comamonas thiooxydans]KGH04124.1 ABC transporter ATP-binding protein [Comamonas thiooxydans]KGH12244.1 ABC transporter ATP-binding protein [Comamonas thiooxydans]UNV92339.1 thiol reductant ABC exporter subunit CydD [Comamonas sp. 7D-2evo1]
MQHTPSSSTDKQVDTAHAELASVIRRPSAGAVWQVFAGLIWLPQAALLAWAVQLMANGQGRAAVWPMAAGVLLLGLLRAWAEGHGGMLANRAARAQLSSLRARVAQSLAQTSPLDKSRPASGQAASAMAEQAEAIVPWLARYQSAMWRVRLLPLVILAAVALQSWVAALILMVAAPLIPLFMAIVGRRAKAASEEQMLQLGHMNAFLLDRLRGLSTLRALHAVELTGQRLRDHAEDLRTRTMRVLRIAFLSSAVLELFSALGVAMVAVYIGFHLLGTLNFGAWGDKLGLGQAMFVLLLAPAFFEPLRDLSAVWHDRAAGEAALQTLQSMQAQSMQIVGAQHAAEASPVDEQSWPGQPVSVSVSGLKVQAPGSDSSLAPLSLHIQAGEHVALWSPSGSGKSVLLAQIAGLLPVQQGRIEIDRQTLEAGSATQLRRRMAWLGQLPHVFAGSAARNIALGRSSVGPEQIAEATQLAALDEALEHRPGASLGEGGAGLSGGEVVRLALARMAAQTQAGLLLVDEPTAHLDPETAAQITQSLRHMARGRTMLVATHDAQLAAAMDRVIELPLLRPTREPQP